MLITSLRKFNLSENPQVLQEVNIEKVREVKVYNLDLAILVRYRVNSTRVQIFREQTNKVLKDYLLAKSID